MRISAYCSREGERKFLFSIFMGLRVDLSLLNFQFLEDVWKKYSAIFCPGVKNCFYCDENKNAYPIYIFVNRGLLYSYFLYELSKSGRCRFLRFVHFYAFSTFNFKLL